MTEKKIFSNSNYINELKESFNKNGFLCISPLFSKDEIKEINTEVNRYIKECVTKMPSHQVYYEKKSDPLSLKQIQQMHIYDIYFKNLIEQSVICLIAEKVLEEKVKPMNLQYFNKPPGVSKETPPHQDGYYWHLKEPKAVTCWLALENIDEENGCINYVRGSHKSTSFRPHARSGILGFSQGITDFGKENDKQNTVMMPGQAGTFLMHDSRTIHWAGANRSQTRSRKALGFIYYAESAEVDEKTYNAYQEMLAKELNESKKI